MNTTDPFRAGPVPHPWALRASWIVLLGSLALLIFGLIRNHLTQWTFSTTTTERSIGTNFWGIWFLSFHDASGKHRIFASEGQPGAWYSTQVNSEVLTDFRFLMFKLYREKFRGADWEGSLLSVCVPYWLFIVPSAILPIRYRRRRVRRWIAWMKLRRLRRRRLALGCCDCGYDLRAAQRRCPECGRAIRMIPTALPLRVRRRRAASV